MLNDLDSIHQTDEGLREYLRSRGNRSLYRYRLTLESPQAPRITVSGREYLAFCSNDYLGLANHPELIAALCEGATQYGVGAGTSHLVSGHSRAHHLLEEALASFTRFPRALLFSTGYMANAGVVTALTGRGDAVFGDKLNHASLNDAALLSRARLSRYPHLDLATLERQLAASPARRKLVISDAVFSMDGDIAPLPELLELCERYDAWLLLDDAHGFGVLGNQGRGSLAHFNISSPRIIYMGTLGKAAGVFGAFVAAQEEIIETLIQCARSYIYTTATPPFLSHALLKSLELIAGGAGRREKLAQLTKLLKQECHPLRWQLLPSDTPIQPLVMGENAEALQVSEALRQKGILVTAIRPPTVPEGTARLRISLSSSHDIEDVMELGAALREIDRDME
ncbi:8-amino-7-oxononanoate synthase [Nitrosospira multiformis ATCC 25196]|uniref:8-amino-7-oxononanoate synthase n=2 Tax=Nitrosospira multiformis (strain ATCC 25196 / NCIMB 11849 / C 71) TaxID=323848 RepID=BIOF_NITMU|nr:8-amino-7-oxononanoate synthase [Nitrosospira multiformis]Q2Y9Y8.1 RecName: Full=8-amino-7-oxononanoate synthase; Short=AONS; AltName: Full=7-keto-8-amino-pelargonic acid synthase; Short=7-KAP synthase; Short=KAPA synthase; AltName: Full=8-amino-7-ketopelargonate synthase [Nitrosospira multiformis ATCC 25196]ABB74433.1 8-amino-7-oxononanoate synthase [Nitrosospira multiformis ATCC 25196]SEF76046.1 8-amino-7-oxononanoate synthase [Nitrosospira multiformis ATCC 25196]